MSHDLICGPVAEMAAETSTYSQVPSSALGKFPEANLPPIELPSKGDKVNISRVRTTADLAAYSRSLRNLLQFCVNFHPSTSSVGFLAPLSDAEADEYWTSLAPRLTEEPISLYLFILTASSSSSSPDALMAGDSTRDVLATVQLNTIPKATHKHRGEVAKLLVRPSARRQRLASRLMDHLEAFAKDELGKEVLTLDTETETPAREFYRRTGWTEWGTCPAYADFANGMRGSATFFVKLLT